MRGRCVSVHVVRESFWGLDKLGEVRHFVSLGEEFLEAGELSITFPRWWKMSSIVPIFKRRIFTGKVIYRLFQLNVWTFQKCKNAHACVLRDCLGVSRPFVSDTSPKCIDRERPGLGRVESSDISRFTEGSWQGSTNSKQWKSTSNFKAFFWTKNALRESLQGQNLLVKLPTGFPGSSNRYRCTAAYSAI